MPEQNIQRKVLRTTCPGVSGPVAKITHICSQHKLNIIQNQAFVDHYNKYFFMRTELEGRFHKNKLMSELHTILPVGSKQELNHIEGLSIVVLVTKEAHCLGDLLMKSAYGDLKVKIAAVISNHNTLETLAKRFDTPFHLVSHKGLTREAHDLEIIKKIDQYNPDYVVLAKYMRMLTPTFVQHYPNQVINIHHSLLPAFIGARPYHQAYERGVKIIGASAHYVNNNLDEGPIILQDVIHIDHTFSTKDIIYAGHNVEKNVLSRALYHILAHQVFVYGNRTAIL